MGFEDTAEEWIRGDAVALILREYLAPSEGKGSPFFPPTFAGTGDEGSGYCIDTMKDGTQTCLVDTAGSQANRMEPMFTKERYRKLIPQVVIAAGSKRINLCDVGHRAADALLKHSSIREKVEDALRRLDGGDPAPLAKLAPTSFVFGLWDSRGTGVKQPRIVTSQIRAYDIDSLTRSAQYFPPANYRDEELMGETSDKKTNDARSNLGFNEVPSTNTHGGVIAHGDIRRDTVVNLVALRKIISNEDELKIQKYILSLSLLAATYGDSWYLRQGCLLTRDREKGEPGWELVHPDGERKDVELNHDTLLEYAAKSAEEFGKGEDIEAEFDKKFAEEQIEKAKKQKKK